MHIVDPMTIYWISKLDVIAGASIIACIVGVALIAFDLLRLDIDNKHLIPNLAVRILIIIATVVCLIIGIMVPDKDTAIQMLLADKLTYETIESTYETLIETSDHIVKMMKED